MIRRRARERGRVLNGVVSLLQPVYYERVLAIMHELQGKCGIQGGLSTPLPHFSWHIAPRYELAGLEARLERIAREARPFPVRATGLGLFTGERPVVYIPVIKSAELIAFHQALWEQTIDLAEEQSPYYAPDRWQPHITLAMFDVTRSNLACLMERLAFTPVDWELRVDQIGLILQEPGGVGRLGRQFTFGR